MFWTARAYGGSTDTPAADHAFSRTGISRLVHDADACQPQIDGRGRVVALLEQR